LDEKTKGGKEKKAKLKISPRTPNYVNLCENAVGGKSAAQGKKVRDI